MHLTGAQAKHSLGTIQLSLSHYILTTSMATRIEHFVSDTLGLTKLPPYLSTVYWSFFSFLFIHQVIAPYFSARYFPVAFSSKRRLARNTWSIHVVSQVHVLVIVPYSFWSILHDSPERSMNPAFGWDEKAGYAQAIACGYFLWDMLDSTINFIDSGFVVHAIACFTVYLMSFKPFMSYYSTRVLFWEISTFFLNIHWFLDKTNRTGSQLQLINGILLLLTFFSARIVYGGYISIQFFSTLRQVRHEIPLAYTLTYGFVNLMLQGLNWFWFNKMITALRKRFRSHDQTKLIQGHKHKNSSTVAINGNGNGHPLENLNGRTDA